MGRDPVGSDKIGCTAETLRSWVRAAERDQGVRPGPATEKFEELERLRKEVKELRRANTILRQASAYTAQAELDRHRRDGRVHRRAS